MKESGTITMGGEYYSQGLKPPLVLTSDQITNSVVGTETNRSTRVSYGSDLQPHAKLVARFFAQALTETEHFLDASLPAPHVYLLRLPGERRTIQFSMTLPEADQKMPWLMLLTNAPSRTLTPASDDGETLWADLRGLPFQIFVLTHEACEMHLINPSNFLVMGDVTGQKGFFKFTLEHHTRWFRDGLANFCALKRSQSFRRQLLEAGIRHEAMRFAEHSMQPFSELARARDKLFDWDQDSKADYYEAATALFLLVEHRAGPEAISAIIRELPKIKFPDGNALLKMITQKTGLDLRLIARTFEFPDLGLETKINSNGQIEIANVAPNSWADRAKLLEGDVLLEANSRIVTGLLDFETEILKTLDAHQTLSLTFLRNGARHITEFRLSLHRKLTQPGPETSNHCEPRTFQPASQCESPRFLHPVRLCAPIQQRLPIRRAATLVFRRFSHLDRHSNRPSRHQSPAPAAARICPRQNSERNKPPGRRRNPLEGKLQLSAHRSKAGLFT